MKDVSVPFSFYDFFAILLPGSVGLLGLYLFVNPALTAGGHQAAFGGLAIGESTNEFVLLTGLIILSYLVGHLFNAFSELLIDRPANAILGWHGSIYLKNLGLLVDQGVRVRDKRGRFTLPKRSYAWAEEKDVKPLGKLVRECIETKFGAVFERRGYSFIFTYVRAFVSLNASDVAGEARLFIATAAMFQSLVLAILLAGIAILVAALTSHISPGAFWTSLLLVILLMTMFFISYRRYKRMWVETLYAGFIVSVRSEKKKTKE
jgi:hypothetical protein